MTTSRVASPERWISSWRVDARCARPNDAVFHGHPERMAKAASMCAGCPCNDVCFWTAMAIEEPLVRGSANYKSYRHGAWGGTLPGQRAEIADLYGPAGPQREALIRRRWTAALTDWLSRRAAINQGQPAA